MGDEVILMGGQPTRILVYRRRHGLVLRQLVLHLILPRRLTLEVAEDLRVLGDGARLDVQR